MTQQYKLRLDEDVIARLDEFARKYGRRSGNQVAAEVIEQYLDFWEYAEAAKKVVLEDQRSVLVDRVRVPVIGDNKQAKKRVGKTGG